MPIKVHNGTSFVEITPKVYNGSSFVTPSTVKVYNGSSWANVYIQVSADPAAGSYSNTQDGVASFNISCTQTATWTYSLSGSTAYLYRSVSNNGSAGGFNMNISHPGTISPSVGATVSNIYANVNGTVFGPWTVSLTARKPPGGPEE